MKTKPHKRPSLHEAKTMLSRFYKSVWFFPAILLVPVIVLSLLQIHGSSIGVYHQMLYGADENDPDLIIGQPKPIRSDEWLVNTQMTLAQANNDFEQVNEALGDGSNLSLLVDAPYKDWSALFKPHNLAFFVLPFDIAFAFKWWVMAYLLIVSMYFFTVSLLRGKRLLGAVLGFALLFSPFVQWWYLFGTLGSLYYVLFAASALIWLLRSKSLKTSILWGLLLSYFSACFVLLLYPPFQVAAALGMIGFGVGYAIEQLTKQPKRTVKEKLAVLAGAFVITVLVSAAYFSTRWYAVESVRNTAYPGERVQESGGFDVTHIMSSHLAAQQQFASKAQHYSLPEQGLTNQSEASNFVFLLPYLILPALILLTDLYRKKRFIDWPLVFSLGVFGFLLIWLFIPGLDFLGKPTLLSVVPHTRLLIGLGLLNFVILLLFIRRLSEEKSFSYSRVFTIGYSVFVGTACLAIGLYVASRHPGFIGKFRILAFALPFPVIVYLLLRKKFLLAVTGLAAFSLLMVFRVHPLYRGTEVITETPLNQTIRSSEDGTWAIEHLTAENFALINGRASLAGVYTYPQIELWQTADPQADEIIYNRYAHVTFKFDRDPLKITPTTLSNPGGDTMQVATEPCSPFLEQQNVRYLLASAPLEASDTCIELIKRVDYPLQSFYIYERGI